MEYDQPTSRYSSTIKFGAIGVVLVVLLLVGVMASKQFITAMNEDPKQPVAVAPENKKETTSKDNKTADQKAQQEKEAQEEKKAEEETKARQAEEETKARQAEEAARRAEIERQAQEAAAAAASQPAITSPGNVASTGPAEDAAMYLLGVFAISFAGMSFVRSRREN